MLPRWNECLLSIWTCNAFISTTTSPSYLYYYTSCRIALFWSPARNRSLFVVEYGIVDWCTWFSFCCSFIYLLSCLPKLLIFLHLPAIAIGRGRLVLPPSIGHFHISWLDPYFSRFQLECRTSSEEKMSRWFHLRSQPLIRGFSFTASLIDRSLS